MPSTPSREWAQILAGVARLIDESHYAVQIRRCSACGQHFFHVFSEFVDWKNGEDAMYSDVVPITPEEAAALIAKGENIEPAEFEALGKDRRRLCDYHPTGKPRTITYAHGNLSVLPGR